MKKSLLILGGGEERDRCIERCERIGIVPEFCAVDPESPVMKRISETARRVHASGVVAADRRSTELALVVARTLNYPLPPATGDATMWTAYYSSATDYALPTQLSDGTDGDALEEAAKKLTLPCWVRAVGPRNGTHCYFVESAADLPLHVEQAVAQSPCELAAIQHATPGSVVRVLGFKMGREYIPVALLDESFREGPYRVTQELRIDSGVSAARDVPLIQLARRAAQALPQGHGLLETEIVVSEDGPKLADIRNRCAVEPAVDALLREALGIALLDDALRLAVGDRPKASATQGLAGALRWLSPPTGVVNTVTGTDVAMSMPGVTEVVVKVKKATRVGHVTDEVTRDAAGYAVAVATRAESAAARAKAACDAITIETDRVTA